MNGEHHFEEEQQKYDEERTEYLKLLGIEVLRIKNTDVLFGRDEVVRRIEKYFNGKLKE